MATLRFSASIFAALATASAYALPAAHPLYSSEMCTPVGERCAGEKGYPAVKWLGCCNRGDVCIPDETKGYGRFCMKKPADYGKGKCYPSGRKCMGVEGKPFVPFHQCCTLGETCQADASLGWGGFCKPHGSGYVENKYVGAKPKCYKTGKRCMGAVSYPHVQFYHCCSEGESCIVDPSMGWGGFCKQVQQEKYVEKYGLDKVDYEYNSDYSYKSEAFQWPSSENKNEKPQESVESSGEYGGDQASPSGTGAEADNGHGKYVKSVYGEKPHEAVQASGEYANDQASPSKTDTEADYWHEKHVKSVYSEKPHEAVQVSGEYAKDQASPSSTDIANDYGNDAKSGYSYSSGNGSAGNKEVGTEKVNNAKATASLTTQVNNAKATASLTTQGLNNLGDFGCSIEQSTGEGASVDEAPAPGVATFTVELYIPNCGPGKVSEAEKTLLLYIICAPVQAKASAICSLDQLPIAASDWSSNVSPEGHNLESFVVRVVVYGELSEDDITATAAMLEERYLLILTNAFPIADVRVVSDEDVVSPSPDF